MFASNSRSADMISLGTHLFILVLDDRAESEMNAHHCQWFAVKGTQVFLTR